MRRLAAILPVLMIVLAACAPQPETITNPATGPVRVNPAEAAAMLNAIRADAGLPPVTVSPTLNRIAAGYAATLAAAGVVDHAFGSTLGDRLAAGGYIHIFAGENLGGGFRSLEEAFAEWYSSRTHRANLLARPATEMGIATAFNGASPYRNFWVFLVGTPAN